jgi:predicted TPR repeat methyltransferase
LDFACGTGRILGHLEQYMDESYGVDVSQSMLDVAERNITGSKLINCDLTSNNIFTGDYFDIITAFRFFLNAQQDLRGNVLQVFNKIIKDDGYLIFNIHMNKGCVLDRMVQVYQKVKNIKDGRQNLLSIAEVRCLLAKSNFEILEMYHFGVIPIYKEDHKLFINLIDKVERYLSNIPYFLPISQYIIYVCQKKSV